MPAIMALAERLNAPVLTTFKAKGQIPTTTRWPRRARPQRHAVASWFMNESRPARAFGASFSNHTGISRTSPIIQVDFEPMALGKFHPWTVPVLGEIGIDRATDLGRVAGPARAADQREASLRAGVSGATRKPGAGRDDRGNGLNAAALFDALSSLVPADAVMPWMSATTPIRLAATSNARPAGADVGLPRVYRLRVPSCHGRLGGDPFGVVLAGRKVVSVSGDGGFGQYLGEFTTAVKYGMNITHVLLNNSELGKISKEQRSGHWPVWETELSNPNFADYATLCGGLGLRVTRADELDAALREGLAAPGPALVEVLTDAELV